MKYDVKTVPTILAVVLLFSIMPILSGCGSKPSSSTTLSQTTTTSQANILVSDGLESVSVPNGWNTHDTSLYPTAVIGVSDNTDGLYLIVTKKPKSNFPTINDYVNTVKDAFSLVVYNPVWGNSSSIKIGGDSGLALQLSGTKKSDNSAFIYYVNVLTGKDFYYTVCGYTPSAYASVNKPILEKVINSFKEAN
jgi:hypothetical protein